MVQRAVCSLVEDASFSDARTLLCGVFLAMTQLDTPQSGLAEWVEARERSPLAGWGGRGAGALEEQRLSRKRGH